MNCANIQCIKGQYEPRKSLFFPCIHNLVCLCVAFNRNMIPSNLIEATFQQVGFLLPWQRWVFGHCSCIRGPTAASLWFRFSTAQTWFPSCRIEPTWKSLRPTTSTSCPTTTTLNWATQSSWRSPQLQTSSTKSSPVPARAWTSWGSSSSLPPWVGGRWASKLFRNHVHLEKMCYYRNKMWNKMAEWKCLCVVCFVHEKGGKGPDRGEEHSVGGA